MIYFLFNNNLSGYERLAFLFAYACALLLSFSLHEFSHAYVAYKCGDRTAKGLGRLTINPFSHLDPVGFIMLLLFGFGYAKPVPINPANFKNQRRGIFFTSIAGVTANLILAFVFSGIYFFVAGHLVAATNLLLIFFEYFFNYMIFVNLVLMIFNLLPIYPLDGYNILACFFSRDNGFLQFLRKYGFFILIIIIITPAFDFVYGYLVEHIIRIFSSFWGLFL